jgi:hypothetical protein
LASERLKKLRSENHTGKEFGDRPAIVSRPDIEDYLVETVEHCLRTQSLRGFRDFLSRYGKAVFPAADVEEYLAHDGRCWFAVYWTGASLWRLGAFYEHCANVLMANNIKPPIGNEYINV